LMNREEEIFASLTLAALLIALIWPAVIADISFQLSFLAVLFIVWGMRRMIDRSLPATIRRITPGAQLVETETTAGETALGCAAVCDLGHRPADRSLFRS